MKRAMEEVSFTHATAARLQKMKKCDSEAFATIEGNTGRDSPLSQIHDFVKIVRKDMEGLKVKV